MIYKVLIFILTGTLLISQDRVEPIMEVKLIKISSNYYEEEEIKFYDKLKYLIKENNVENNKKEISEVSLEYDLDRLLQILKSLEEEDLREVYRDKIVCQKCSKYTKEKYIREYLTFTNEEKFEWNINDDSKIDKTKEEKNEILFRDKSYNYFELYEISYNDIKYSLAADTKYYKNKKIKELIDFIKENIITDGRPSYLKKLD